MMRHAMLLRSAYWATKPLLSLCGTLFTLPSGLMLGMYLRTPQRDQ
jgi:hypothetical protein